MVTLRNNSGFTLLELIMVIVILAIIGVTVLPKMSANSLNVPNAAEVIANDITYTQMNAMSNHARLYVNFANNATTYCYSWTANTNTCPAASFGTTLRNLGDINSNVKIGTGQSIAFNSLGEATNTTDVTITVTDGTMTKSIVVKAYTGKVSIL
jgi:prepilin-type N-terminal cleavage/methylation domain-containing protein